MSPRLALCLFVTAFLGGQVGGFVIDSKLDLPSPELKTDDGRIITIDSSLSPKVVKAFYEVTYVQSPVKPSGSSYLIYDDAKCPYSKEICKYYFVPKKVSTVQKVDELISSAGDIPVVAGIQNSGLESLVREINRTVSEQVNKVVPLSPPGSKVDEKKEEDDVPVFTGVATDEYKKPEARPPYYHRPQQWDNQGWSRPCIRGPCTEQWANPHPPYY